MAKDLKSRGILGKLERTGYSGMIFPMKLTLAVIVYLLIGLILGLGILFAVEGSYWLLISSFIIYVIAFARIGCIHQG
jgi:hypothetical protein